MTLTLMILGLYLSIGVTVCGFVAPAILHEISKAQPLRTIHSILTYGLCLLAFPLVFGVGIYEILGD